MNIIIEQQYKRWGKSMDILSNRVVKLSTRPTECLSKVCEEYNKLYDVMIETCQEDIMGVLENELHYLVDFYKKMNEKLHDNKLGTHSNKDIIQYIEKKIKLDAISKSEEKIDEWTEYIEDTIYEHQLFYKLNNKNFTNEEKVYSSYSAALSLYNLNIDNTELFLNKLSKQEEVATDIEQFIDESQVLVDKKEVKYTITLQEELKELERLVKNIDKQINLKEETYKELIKGLNYKVDIKKEVVQSDKRKTKNTMLITKLVKIGKNKRNAEEVNYAYGK